MTLALLLVFFGTLINYLTLGQLHTDVLLFLYESENLINGKQLYIDLIDLNSPLIFYINYPAVYISRIFGISLELSLILFSYVFLVFLSLLLYYFLQLVLRKVLPKKQIYIVFFTFLLQIYASGHDFLQRDYLIVIFVLLYVFSKFSTVVSLEIANKYLRFLTGLILAVGIFIKPLYILVPVVFEIYLLFKYGRKFKALFVAEDIGLLFGGTLIAGVLAKYLPSYFHTLFLTYSLYGGFLSHYKTALTYAPFFSGFYILLLYIILRIPKQKRNILEVFMLLYFLGCIIVLIQNKFFSHHFYLVNFSATALLILMCSFIYLDYKNFSTQNKKNSFLINVLFLISLTFTFLTSFYRPLLNSRYSYLDVSSDKFVHLSNMTRDYANADSYINISTTIYPLTFLEHFSHTKNISPFFNLWFLPGFYSKSDMLQEPFKYNSISEMSDIEKQYFDLIVNKVIHEHPSIIFIDVQNRKNGFRETSFDYVEYYSQDPEFKDAFAEYYLVDYVFDENFAMYGRKEE